MQASWTFCVKLITMMIRLIRNVIIARILGPTERGILAVLMAIPEVFATIGAGGLTGSASFFGARLSREGSFAPALLLLSGGVSLFVGIAVLAFFSSPSFFKGYYESASPYALLICAVTALFVMKLTFNGMLTGMGKVGAFNAMRLLESAIPLAGFLAFWAMGVAPFKAAIIAWAGAYVVINIAALLILFKSGVLSYRATAQSMKQIVSYAGRNHVDRAAQIVLRRSDYFFLSYFIGATATGYYAIATIGAELLLSLSEAVNVPMTRRLFKDRETPRIAVAITVGRLTFIATLVGAIVLCLIASPAIYIAFGEAFTPAAPALIWLAPGVVALATGSVFRLALLGDEKPGVVSSITAASSVLCIVLNFLLIPSYGIVGAAIASSAAYSAAAFAFIITALRNGGCNPMALLAIGSEEKAFWARIITKVKMRFS